MSSLVESPEYQAAARFVDLTLEKKALHSRIDEINKQLETLEPALVGYLSAAGIPTFAVKNYLIFPQREPWVYPATGFTRQMVCEALKLSGLGDMVSENYSTQSLTRYVKDLEDQKKVIAGLTDDASLDKLLPPALAHALNVKAAFRIRIKEQKKKQSYAFNNSEEYRQGEEHEQP